MELLIRWFPLSKYGYKSFFLVVVSEAMADEWAVSMRLETLDRLNQSMIAVATVARVNGDTVLIAFDDWRDYYDYSTENSNEHLHPNVTRCSSNLVQTVR